VKRIEVGDPAPDIQMETHRGDMISLADYKGSNPVVLFFYPKDGTPVCTKEACAFRDAHEIFAIADAVIIGVSGDTIERHRSFAESHDLPYVLVSDTDGQVRKAFGVKRTMGIMPGRVTYVIDREGIVQHVFRAAFAADRHVGEALDSIRKLKS